MKKVQIDTKKKKVLLLNKVFIEKKSIKDSSKQLSIKYTESRKIIRKFKHEKNVLKRLIKRESLKRRNFNTQIEDSNFPFIQESNCSSRIERKVENCDISYKIMLICYHILLNFKLNEIRINIKILESLCRLTEIRNLNNF
jgi:hypothetical protein